MAQTYEFDGKYVLEKYEWNDVWWEDTTNKTGTRFLYVGDSISCGLRRWINQYGNGELLFDNLATSKSLENPYFKETIQLFAKQQIKCDGVIFNNAAHGTRLDYDTFKKYYDDMCEFLKEEFPGLPIFLVSGSYLADPERCQRLMVDRGEIAKGLCEKHGFTYLDIFDKTKEQADKMEDDGVHFLDEGNEEIGKYFIELLKKHL